MKIFQSIKYHIIKILDQDISLEVSNTFLGTLKVGFLTLRTWAFSAKFQMSPFLSILEGQAKD